MNIVVQNQGPAAVIQVSGRIDALHAPKLQEVVDQQLTVAAQRLVFDLSGVHYVSSAGLRVLFTAAKRLGNRRNVAVCGLNDNVRDILSIAGFEYVLTICEDVAGAQAAVAAVV